MTLIRRRVAAAGLLVAIAAGACGGGGGGGGGGQTAAPPGGETKQDAEVDLKVGGVFSPAATLRADLTRLLQEHVYLAGFTTTLILQGKDPAPAVAVLDANTAALGEKFGIIYDDAAATRFLELWRAKTSMFLQFAQATAAGDAAAAAKVKSDLTLYQAQYAEFINATNPQLAADAMKTDAGSHVNGFLSAVTAVAKNDPLALSKLRKAAAAMPQTSAVVAAGIVKQMSDAFAGKADDDGATLLATLTAALQDHVYLLGATTRTAAAGGDAKKAREVLEENSEGLGNLVGAIYGDREGRRFLTIWRSHIGAFLEDVKAAANKDAAATAKVGADLDRFRASLGAFLDDVNPNLPRQAVAADFEDYVAAVRAAIAAQASGDPAEFQRLRDAAATTPLLAELLAGAISKQFDKFS